ncbi:hypothetical protein EYB31_26320 [Paenibacillus thalictri]|uniref:Uncharacterized protein n=2 Tax=Paenibacillus thalictri TaxID=2527873 RepID=A0A4Q9DJB7_9BACL|nr:hypothetical protein EYB31_26320 [Paenibacillus thalictri]
MSEKSEKRDKKIDQIEEMIGTLIQMVGNVGARLEEVAHDLKDTKEILHTFRSETDVNFKKLDRRVKLIESDLDETMVKVAEMTTPKQ